MLGSGTGYLAQGTQHTLEAYKATTAIGMSEELLDSLQLKRQAGISGKGTERKLKKFKKLKNLLDSLLQIKTGNTNPGSH